MIEDYVMSAFERLRLLDGVEDVHALDYVASGIDSLEIVTLITDLEEEFGFQFTADDLQDPTLRTVGGLIELAERRQGANDGD